MSILMADLTLSHIIYNLFALKSCLFEKMVEVIYRMSPDLAFTTGPIPHCVAPDVTLAL